MQSNLTTLDTNQFVPFSVGFDNLFEKLFDVDKTSVGYPPYNIVKSDVNNYIIEMALAGFEKKDIEIQYSDGELSIKSKIKDRDLEKNEIIHQGISYRNFSRKFTLAEDIFVKNAEMNNGMLSINLEKIIPDNKKPKLISIK